jgi:hypothetical protein
MTDRAKSWIAEHAGTVMAALMFAGQAVGIAWWASAMTAQLASLERRVAVVETAGPIATTQFSHLTAQLAALNQKISDLSNFVMKRAP